MRLRWNTHSGYFRSYVFCQLLHLAIVTGHLHLLNIMSGHLIVTHGLSVLKTLLQIPSERSDPLAQLFPPVVKCVFEYHGLSGTVQVEDALCLLNLNPTYEKMFLIIWLWFLIVAAVTIVHLLYLLAMASIPSLRFINRSNMQSCPKDSLMRCKISLFRFERMHIAGDWFLLKLISHNMDYSLFLLFLNDLQQQLGGMGEVQAEQKPVAVKGGANELLISKLMN